MKKITLAALAFSASAAFATPTLPDCTSGWDNETTGVKGCSATNTLVLDNTIDILSSRQNVWVCGVGIRNTNGNVGADNAVYYTESTYLKGRNQRVSYTSRRIEAPVDGTYARSIDLVAANQGYFNKTHETRISGIRAELSSLNYGAEIYVDVCGEAPMAYYDNPNRDRHARLELLAFQQIVDLTENGNGTLVGRDYVSASSLTWGISSIFTGTIDEYSYVGAAAPSNWDLIDNAGNITFATGFTTFGAETLVPAYSASAMEAEAVADTRDPVATVNEHPADLNKYVVRYTVRETSSSDRLKGLTEGARWQQHIQSDYSVCTSYSGYNTSSTTYCEDN